MKTPNSISSPIRLAAAAAFGALALGFTSMSVAAEVSDVPQVTVTFSDLNTSSPRDVATLYGRIERAADEVCEPYDMDFDDSVSNALLNACVQKAISHAVTEARLPQLSTIYEARN